jgi:hypothetical protein
MDDVFGLFRARLEKIREQEWPGDNALKIWEEAPGQPGVKPHEDLLDAIARHMVEALTER